MHIDREGKWIFTREHPVYGTRLSKMGTTWATHVQVWDERMQELQWYFMPIRDEETGFPVGVVEHIEEVTKL